MTKTITSYQELLLNEYSHDGSRQCLSISTITHRNVCGFLGIVIK